MATGVGRVGWLARCLLGFALLVAGHLPVAGQPVLESYYVATPMERGDRIVEVRQDGHDVHVRTIVIQHRDEACPSLAVEAFDEVIPNTAIETVAGAQVCTLTEEALETILAASRDTETDLIDFFGSTSAVVATCSGEERRFVFKVEAGNLIDDQKLATNSVVASRLYAISSQSELASRPGTQAEREALGTRLVAELASGKYESAYLEACRDLQTGQLVPCEPNYLAWRLEGYEGAPKQAGPLPIELVDHSAFRLRRYVAPVYPHIARNARVRGRLGWASSWTS